MGREYKIWNNGNKCAIALVDEYSYVNPDDVLCTDDGFGILGTNLKNYDISYGNSYQNEILKTTSDVFYWVMREQKIKSFNFTAKNLIKEFSETYINADGEEVKIEDKEMSVEELTALLLDMADNECFGSEDMFNIIINTNFENFIIKQFFAYIHSDISISLRDYKDPWDSGIAGFTWLEPYGKESEENMEKYFAEDFQTYKEVIEGEYVTVDVSVFEKENGEWKNIDRYTTFEKSIEDAWESLDYAINNEVECF